MSRSAGGRLQFLTGFHHHRLNILVDLFLDFPPRNRQLILRLKVYPEFRRSSKETPQPKGHLRGDASLFVNDGHMSEVPQPAEQEQAC